MSGFLNFKYVKKIFGKHGQILSYIHEIDYSHKEQEHTNFEICTNISLSTMDHHNKTKNEKRNSNAKTLA